MTLDEIVDRPNRHGQRATYAAVGGVCGRIAMGVMAGRPKDPPNSWVVSKTTGLPSGYTTAQIDRRLAGSPPPIDTPEQLRAWLARHR